jgi:hypothetical protein
MIVDTIDVAGGVGCRRLSVIEPDDGPSPQMINDPDVKRVIWQCLILPPMAKTPIGAVLREEIRHTRRHSVD